MKDLHQEFVKLGRERNKITYQLLALLPEIYKNRIHEQHECATIYEYAGKFAGLSFDVVRKALNVNKNLEDKPCLRKAVQTQGIHKVGIVARLATPETDQDWADKVENMSKTGLQELSKEVRGKRKKIVVELDDEMEFLLLKIKKERKCWNNEEALRLALKETACSKQDQVSKPKKVKKIPGDFSNKKTTRYIPAAKKHEVLAKSGGRCVYPGCSKPAEHFHHTNPFSKSKNHDSIVGLCKEHHEFAHNGLIKNQEEDPKKWELALNGKPDWLFRKYRRMALAGLSDP